jgi:DNA (cytosine-5)-methyltransferase 1
MNRKIISLFSGAGGMDIGFHSAGFNTGVCVEHDSSCCATLRRNMPSVPVIEGDICKISTQDILNAANLRPLEAALVIGGPPCQSFSLAGKRMGLNDPRGRLVLEFIRVVRESLPIGFVMENVRGLVNWENGKALRAILEEAATPIKYDGKIYKYEITYKVLNAVNYGVPQFRERIFIVGNRIGKQVLFPEPSHVNQGSETLDLFKKKYSQIKTVKEAIGNLPPANPPSEVAIRVSQTINDRIKNHGY